MGTAVTKITEIAVSRPALILWGVCLVASNVVAGERFQITTRTDHPVSELCSALAVQFQQLNSKKIVMAPLDGATQPARVRAPNIRSERSQLGGPLGVYTPTALSRGSGWRP